MAPKLALAVLSPVMLLGLAEGVTRLADVGYPTAPWVPGTRVGRPILRDNEFFTYRFVPPTMARVSCIAQMDREKPAETLRIAVLGESAALGDPMSDFGPPRLLQELLRLRYPGRNIEVVNGAITAINSHIIREIARELPGIEPDIVLLYIGNNEVIGPYGPGTVYDGFFSSDALVRAGVLASRLRLVQMARFGAAVAMEGHAQTEFNGLSMFTNRPVAHNDPRLPVVRRRFAGNLREILRSATSAGAHALLCTVAVNRRDCPPTLALNRPGLAPSEREAWRQAYQRGREAVDREDWDQALERFSEAAALDDTHAELAWLTGFCLEKTGQPGPADAAFRAACELDAFRYRTDDALNDTLREIAAENGDRITFLDADGLFWTNAPDTDAELFVDHVHFSLKGAYLLATAWARALAATPPFAGLAPEPMPSLEQIREALLYTPYCEMDFGQRLLNRHTGPPFDGHFGSSNRIQRLLRQNAELEQAVQLMDVDAARRAVRHGMATHPDDPFFPLHWGMNMLALNRRGEAIEALREAVEKAPHRTNLRVPLARALAAAGRPEDAAAAMLDGRRKQGYFAAEGTFQILSALLSNGQADEALAFCRIVHQRIRPRDYRWRVRRAVAQLQYLVGQRNAAYARMENGELPEAMQAWRSLLDVRRDMPEPFFWLGAIPLVQGYPSGSSKPLLENSLQRWGDARGAYHLGILKARTGAVGEARLQLEKAAGLSQDDFELAYSLAWVFRSHPDPDLHDPERARRLIEQAEPLAPTPYAAWENQARPLGAWLLTGPKLRN